MIYCCVLRVWCASWAADGLDSVCACLRVAWLTGLDDVVVALECADGESEEMFQYLCGQVSYSRYCTLSHTSILFNSAAGQLRSFFKMTGAARS